MKRFAMFILLLSTLTVIPLGCRSSNTTGTPIENPGPTSTPPTIYGPTPHADARTIHNSLHSDNVNEHLANKSK